MRNISAAFFNALNASRDTGISPRQFVWFTVKDRETGLPVSTGFWTGDEDIAITVISPITGLPEGRTYYGAQNLFISPIVRVTDATIQSVNISLSQISLAAQQLIRGYDLRLGKVEIHEMLIQPRSNQVVSPPEIVFLGEVDKSPITTPSVGEDGSLDITAVSDAISMLSIKNPAKSSAEFQLRRNSGDSFGRYSSTIATWNIPWGTKTKQNKASQNNGSGKSSITDLFNTLFRK